MNHLRLYLSSGIFVAVTVLKLVLPEQTAHARQEVVELIDMDMDYRGAMMQVGTLLSEESVHQVIELLGGERYEAIGESITSTEPPAETTEPTPVSSPSPTVPPTPIPTEVLTNNVLNAMEAFKASQQAYAEYATPATVSYGNLCIPFSYCSPVAGVTSSGFGYRVHPIGGSVRFHYGTDYAVDTGTPIAAFADGEVSMTGYEKGYGNFVEITHADGWKTLYAHCSEVHVKWYQKVKEGDIIALAGETGEATGPHLHLELTHDGYYTNPEFFF